MNTSDNYDNWTLEQKTQTLEIAVNFITRASTQGNLQDVKELHAMIAEKFDITVDTSDVHRLQHAPLEAAAEKGHHKIVDYLIPLSVFDHNNKALRKAAEKGRKLCVQVLIPQYSPEQLSDALLQAVYTRHWVIANMFLALDPPRINDKYELCLIWASAHKNPKFLKRFYTLCNPDRAMELIQKAQERGGGWCGEQTALLRQYHSPEAQRERLVQQVGKLEGTSRRAKI